MLIVTGANGFIGSAFVWELNARGIDDLVLVDPIRLDTRPELLAQKKFNRFLLKDDLWTFLKSPESSRIRGVVHMGACSSTTELDVEFLRENNTLYTQRLWEWCRDRGVTFIYASSGACYGDGQKGFDDATDPEELIPLNPYGDSKINFDRWAVRQPTAPPHWYGLRFFNVFGPNENFKGDMSSVVFKAFHQIQKTGKLKLFRSHNASFADGQQMRDFIYVKDITAWMISLLEKKPASGIYNMGYGKARTWLDLAHGVFNQMGRSVQIEWMDVPLEMRPRYQYFTEAKMDRLFSLGLNTPNWSLEAGIADYVTHYLKAGRFL